MAATRLLPNLLQSVSIRRFHSFYIFHHYSTAALQPQPQPQPLSVLHNYLINSIGFTPEAASTAVKKVRLHKSFTNDPDLVINYFNRLGLDNNQIKSIVSVCPHVLTYNVKNTLEPKIRVLQGIGLTGSGIVKVLCGYQCLLVKGVEPLSKRIQFLKDLLGSNENVAKALLRCATLLHVQAQKDIEYRVSLLREIGLSDHDITRLLMLCPTPIMRSGSQQLQDVSDMVEHDLGIPRDSRMFIYGLRNVINMPKSVLEERLGVFRRFGWSDAIIQRMVGSFPAVIGTSEDKLAKCLGFFMGELGFSPEVLASNPVAFCFSLERVKLRNDVLNVLNEKKLNQRKRSRISVLLSTDKIFVKNYLLPHQNEIPKLYESYIEKFGPQLLFTTGIRDNA